MSPSNPNIVCNLFNLLNSETTKYGRMYVVNKDKHTSINYSNSVYNFCSTFNIGSTDYVSLNFRIGSADDKMEINLYDCYDRLNDQNLGTRSDNSKISIMRISLFVL